MTAWLSVIGMGDDGLPGLNPAARTLVETAQTLVGGARHLAMVPPGEAERLIWRQPLADTIPEIEARRGTRVAVLASGDPLWYGVGVVLARHFPREEMTIVPQPGAFSLAAARLGWALAECSLLSLHARPLDILRLHLAPGRRCLILSEDGTTPRLVAGLLAASGWGPSRISVFEHLGGAREAVVDGTAQDWGERTSADLNTIALECRVAPGARVHSRLAGLPDDAFEHDGQLTKREMRAITLARLGPLPGETLWDIGAGSGSIAIEWLRAIPDSAALAIEKNPGRAAVIAHNAATLGVPGLQIIAGAAPQALAKIPPELARPDAIFVGGGIAAADLLPALWAA
ncbi:MAG: precorrin-6y C5,15-methyltransferase (decarboxylating) subunit CbiE, partial [Stellaceae bacterium]